MEVQDALVIVHAAENFLKEDAVLAIGIRARISEYLKDEKPVIYAAYAEQSETDMPFLRKDEIRFIPPSGKTIGETEMMNVYAQAAIIKEILEREVLHGRSRIQVEVIGGNRNGCLNRVKKGIETVRIVPKINGGLCFPSFD